jgi:septal ring-binding cell division protein DamX
MASTRKRARSGALLDLDRWRELVPAVAMVIVVAGILVLTAILQVDGDVPERTELRADGPLDAIPVEPGPSSEAEETGTVDDLALDSAPPVPPVAAPAPGPEPSSAGDAAEDRARRDLERLRAARTGLTLQLGVMCDADNARARMSELGAEADLYFLPFDSNGRACYRVCWGVFPDRAAAERARLPGAVGAVFTDSPVIKDVALVAP